MATQVRQEPAETVRQLLMTPRFQLTPDGEESSDNQNALYDSLSMMRHPTTPTTLLLFQITQLQVQK